MTGGWEYSYWLKCDSKPLLIVRQHARVQEKLHNLCLSNGCMFILLGVGGEVGGSSSWPTAPLCNPNRDRYFAIPKTSPSHIVHVVHREIKARLAKQPIKQTEVTWMLWFAVYLIWWYGMMKHMAKHLFILIYCHFERSDEKSWFGLQKYQGLIQGGGGGGVTKWSPAPYSLSDLQYVISI